MTELTLERARRLVDAAEAKAVELGIRVAITVLDGGTQTVLFARMDGTQLASTTISHGKAYTAVAWERPSGELWAIAQPGARGFGINSIDSRFVIAAGGVPLVRAGSIVGAIGVSGGTQDEDQQCADSAAQLFASLIA